MPRPKKPLHTLVLYEHNGRAVVWYAGREWAFGPWAGDKPSAEAAVAFERQKAVWAQTPQAVPAAGGPVLTLAALWSRWALSGTAPSDRNKELTTCGKLLLGTGEHPHRRAFLRVEEFGTRELAEWQAELCLLKRPDGTARYGLDSVTRFVRWVRQCVRWGVQFADVPPLVHAALTLVDPPAKKTVRQPRKRRAVLWEHVAAALPHLSEPPAVAVRLLWHTCARPSELLSVTRGEVVTGGVILPAAGVPIDLDAAGVWAVLKAEHKTADGGYDRVIFLGPRARAALAPLMERPAERCLFRPADVHPKYGERYTAKVLLRAVQRACRRAGVPPFEVYSVRHAAFKLVQAKYGRDGARVYGGHKVGGVTEVYAGADLTLAAKIAAEWG